MSSTEALGRAQAALGRQRTVLLVDWHEEVPRSLIGAGHRVLSYEGSYFRHELAATSPAGARVVPPSKPHHRGHMVYVPMSEAPREVDLVCTYRPGGEQVGIVEHFVLPLRARWFWVERGDEGRIGKDPDAIIECASDEARAACEAAGVAVVEGFSVPVVLAGMHNSPDQAPA